MHIFPGETGNFVRYRAWKKYLLPQINSQIIISSEGRTGQNQFVTGPVFIASIYERIKRFPQ